MSSVEILQFIRKAEEEAEDIIKKSAADSRRIVSQAESQSRQLLEKLDSDIENNRKKIISEAEDAANAEIKIKMQEIAKQCEDIKRKAGEKIDDAVNIIVGRIVKLNGNS
ncbi:MAG TPA: hypothetical protein GXX36_00245 [Clostridiaceae bacterium]|nr:hypothetical protein [Clostridiaceae bacterium]